jgi:hypothetical protein
MMINQCLFPCSATHTAFFPPNEIQQFRDLAGGNGFPLFEFSYLPCFLSLRKSCKLAFRNISLFPKGPTHLYHHLVRGRGWTTHCTNELDWGGAMRGIHTHTDKRALSGARISSGKGFFLFLIFDAERDSFIGVSFFDTQKNVTL